MPTRRTLTLLTVLAAVLLPRGAALASTSTYGFKTGLYTGTTSQHQPFAFYLRVTSCGHKSGLCLYAKTQAYISEACKNGYETNAYGDPGPLLVGKSGIVKETMKLFSTVVTYIKLGHNGTASGRFTATTEEAEGCTSGTVIFTARRQR